MDPVAMKLAQLAALRAMKRRFNYQNDLVGPSARTVLAARPAFRRRTALALARLALRLEPELRGQGTASARA